MMKEGLDEVSEAYKKCKKLEKPVISASGYDISTNTIRSFTVVNPIFMDYKGEQLFNGAIIWESMNLPKIFNEMIIPKSFRDGKYPFIQVRMPEFPREEDKVSSGSGRVLYPTVNAEFRATVPAKEWTTAKEWDLSGPDVEAGDRPFVQPIFDKLYPLGEILYEDINSDELGNLNFNEDYITFVNLV